MKTSSNSKKPNEVQGVYCDAKHCSYNDAASRVCTASQIDVGTTSAHEKNETLCKTFECR